MIAWRKTLTALILTMPVIATANTGQVNGSASTSAEIILRIPDLVRISGLQDMQLEWQGADSSFRAANPLCVYRNGNDGHYSVRVSSNNGAGSGFQLTREDSSVPYQVNWNGVQLNDGISSGLLSGAHTSSSNCAGSNNVDLQVEVRAEDSHQASMTGLHSDTLTVTVVAE